MTGNSKLGLAALIGGIGAYISFSLSHGTWIDPTALATLFGAIATGLGLIFSKSGTPST